MPLKTEVGRTRIGDCVGTRRRRVGAGIRYPVGITRGRGSDKELGQTSWRLVDTKVRQLGAEIGAAISGIKAKVNVSQHTPQKTGTVTGFNVEMIQGNGVLSFILS